MKTNLAKNTILLSIGILMTKGLQFIMIPFFSKWLSVEDYGIFDVLCTYVMLCIPILSLASTDSIFRLSIDAKAEDKNKYITNGFLIYFRNIIIFSIIMIFIGIFFKWKLAIPFTLLAIGELFNDYFQGCLRGLKKLNIYSACMGITTLFIAVFTTLFIKGFDLGLSGIIYGYTIGYIIGDILIAIKIKFTHYFSWNLSSKKIRKEMISYSFPLIFNNLSWWIVNVSDRSIIRIFLGATANGIYAIANKIPSLCTSVFGMFSISWQETASEMVDNKKRNKYFNFIYNKSIAILFSLCIGILSANFILFDYIFDIKYTLARYQAPILVFSIFLYSISQFLGGIQISFRNPKENSITTIVGAVVNVIVHLSLIKIIGLYAASISTLVSNIVLVILRKYRLRKKVPLKLEIKNIFYSLIFSYMLIMQFIKVPIFINVTNLILSCGLFIFINKDFVFKLLKKVGVKK